MWYFPNVEAARWFVERVLPLVRREEPKVKLSIVGARPVPSVQRLAAVSGVDVTGFVPRLRDHLARAAVAVAPMRSGSGMQFKVIEAMAMGTPVVATPFALGGLKAIDGKHLLVAESAEAFAAKLVLLLRDQVLQRRLSHHAGRLVEDNYTWERTVEALERVYSLALARSPRSAENCRRDQGAAD
jgi:glycosyltransferase involved in cell wall biosynthesis